jgi:hypothetical protein
MAKRKKRKGFSAVKAVKSLAREQVGTPPPTRRESAEVKRERKAEKHKPTLSQFLNEE